MNVPISQGEKKRSVWALSPWEHLNVCLSRMPVIGTLFFSSCTAFILCIVYSSWPQDVWEFYVRKGVHFIKVKAETSSGWWLRRLQPRGMISSSLKRLGRMLMIQLVDIWDSHLHVSYVSCPPKKSHQTLQKSPLSTVFEESWKPGLLYQIFCLFWTLLCCECV